MRTRVFWSIAAAVAVTASASAATVLIEAESFAGTGGWVVDPQFMDQMGSPYLLAHGLGRPVRDAQTTAEIPSAGRYRVWVRTMDWVARWKAPGTPGRFQVLVNGRAVEHVFGTTGAAWHWEDGGLVELPAGRATVALHDLTGFEGRCDAIVFAPEGDPAPPNRDPEMAAWRRERLGQPEKPEDGGAFDLVVTGGGLAGTCAAITAARLGLAVAFVQDRPVVGGNNSSEVRVWLQGARNKDPWPRVGDVVAELEPSRRAHYGPENTADLYEDEKKLAVVRGEPNVRLFLEHRVNAVDRTGSRIAAVIAQDIRSGRRLRLAGRWFADCTGDGAVGFLAGADYDMTTEGHMGPCNLWHVDAASGPRPFPRCPWALDLADKPFPGRSKTKPDIKSLGGWYWECGFDLHPIDDMETMRDWNFRAMYGAWDAMKNVDGVLPDHELKWAAHIMGKRESRRLLGDVVVTGDDLRAARKFPDGCVPTGWKMDLHLPDPRYEKGFEGNAFISRADFGTYPMPFWIPYRCLYSRNVPNLFMAGRCISVTHEALGAVRVMRTGGCMGEIVGMAASVCRKQQCDPRDVHERYLPALQDLMIFGAGKKPEDNPDYENQGEPGGGPRRAPIVTPVPASWVTNAGPNLLREAKVTVSSSRDAAKSPPALLMDGAADLKDNAGRWLSGANPPHVIEFAWDAPRTFNAARVVSGFRQASGVVDSPASDFAWEYHDGTAWKAIPGVEGRANAAVDWSARFPAVTADKVRIRITGTTDGMARIWEAAVYEAPWAPGVFRVQGSSE